jgi:phosphate transport system substrate-binding protein
VNRSVLSRAVLVGAALAALTVAGCASETPEPTPEGSTPATNEFASLSGELRASGASFPNSYYQAAIDAFEAVAPDLAVTYESVGSGTGKKDFGAGLNDFAGTDSTVKDGDGPAAGSYYYIPTVAAPITVSFNISGVSQLKLSPDTLAKIFQGDITDWSDAAITADNGTALASRKITVVHRSDGSGTTNNLTKYLVAAAPSWKLKSGDTVSWPATTVGAERNGGVAQSISQTDGAIGYVDFADATAANLKFAALKNKDGNFVAASLDGATAALAGATLKDDLTYDPLNAAGADSYPITAPTYLLVKPTYDDAETAKNVKGFITWLLTDGTAVAEEVGYASLPDSIRDKALTKLESVKP